MSDEDRRLARSATINRFKPIMVRTRLATGIYKDKFGIAIRISVQGKPVDYRRDHDGTPYLGRSLGWLKDERIRRQAAATLTVEREVQADTLFSADVLRFLHTISSHGHRVNTQGYMAHWEQHFAGRQRNDLTDLDVQTAYATIQQKPSTKIHIRRALIQFYEALNGKSGYNPGRSLKKPAKPEEPIRDLPWTMIERMFDALPPSRTRARLMLIAYIGLPHKQIKALRPIDLRLDARELAVHPRRKGAGVSGRVVPLSDYAIAALKEFQRMEAFGTFQNRQLVETFRSGAKRAGVTLPPGAVPYDLRHSFLTELARGGADIRDIAHLGMHATLEQAARYIKGAASERATTAITSIPRFSTTTNGQKPPIRSTSAQRGTTPKPRAGKRKTAKKR